MYIPLRVSRADLFVSQQGKIFPQYLWLLADLKRVDADVDVIIGVHDQPEAVNAVIENFLLLEKKARLHVLVIESSGNLRNMWKIRPAPNVSRITLLSNPAATDRLRGGSFSAANGAALAAQLGHYLGRARYAFYSHTDMIACKENFLSFLLEKTSEIVPVAAMTQRHVIPFTGGMLYDKQSFVDRPVDWIPLPDTSPGIPALQMLDLGPLQSNTEWMDAGEQFVYDVMRRGLHAFVAASRGATGDFFGDPMTYYFSLKPAQRDALSDLIDYAPTHLDRETFSRRYPDLTHPDNEMWRKSFDDDGDLIFIHRGRGTSVAAERGDFTQYVRRLNAALAKNA